jgi:hypothetical protein
MSFAWTPLLTTNPMIVIAASFPGLSISLFLFASNSAYSRVFLGVLAHGLC